MAPLGAQVPSPQQTGAAAAQQPLPEGQVVAPDGHLAGVGQLAAQPPPWQQAWMPVQLVPSGQQTAPAGRHLPAQQLPFAQGTVPPQQRPALTHWPPQQSDPGEQQASPQGSEPIAQGGGPCGGGSSGLAAQ